MTAAITDFCLKPRCRLNRKISTGDITCQVGCVPFAGSSSSVRENSSALCFWLHLGFKWYKSHIGHLSLLDFRSSLPRTLLHVQFPDYCNASACFSCWADGAQRQGPSTLKRSIVALYLFCHVNVPCFKTAHSFWMGCQHNTIKTRCALFF